MLNFWENCKKDYLKKLVSVTVFCFFTFLFLSSSPVFAFNPEINYQGKLADSLGVTVPDGEYNMRFWLLTDDIVSTTSALWTEERVDGDKVSVKNGLFSLMLGAVTPFGSLDFNQTLYLGVEIGGVDTTPNWDGEMSPRKVLGAVPAAFTASTLNGHSDQAFLRSDATSTASELITFSAGLLSSLKTILFRAPNSSLSLPVF